MAARSTFNQAKMQAAILAGVDRGLRTIAVTLGATVKEMLSKPGRGRVYIRKRNGLKFGKGLRHITRSELAGILLDRRLQGKKKRTLRSLGFHKASAPGDPPAVDTGNLRRSWQTGFRAAKPSPRGSFRRMAIGSNVVYARALEFGHGATKPRPYLRPSVRKVQPSAQSIMDAAVARAVQSAGLSR